MSTESVARERELYYRLYRTLASLNQHLHDIEAQTTHCVHDTPDIEVQKRVDPTKVRL